MNEDLDEFGINVSGAIVTQYVYKHNDIEFLDLSKLNITQLEMLYTEVYREYHNRLTEYLKCL